MLKKPGSPGFFLVTHLMRATQCGLRMQSYVNAANPQTAFALYCSKEYKMHHKLLSVCLLAISTGSFAQALPESSPAAVWRVTSRLGYGPTPAIVQTAAPSATVWGLAQIEAARAASQNPPRAKDRKVAPKSAQMGPEHPCALPKLPHQRKYPKQQQHKPSQPRGRLIDRRRQRQ